RGRGDFPRRSLSRDRGQSVHLVFHGRDEERQVRLRVDRRQRLFRNGFGQHQRRMKVVATIVLTSLLMAASIVLRPLIATEIPATERRSGYTFMGPETRAMQDDNTSNPGMLGVLDGEALWNRKAAAAGKSCADCHHDARDSMKGAAARYPAYDKALGRPVNLEQRINLCRVRHQEAEPLPYEKHDL